MCKGYQVEWDLAKSPRSLQIRELRQIFNMNINSGMRVVHKTEEPPNCIMGEVASTGETRLLYVPGEAAFVSSC